MSDAIGETAEETRRVPGRGFRLDYSISLGALLQAGIVATGLIAWAVNGSNRGDELQREMALLEQRVGDLNLQVCGLRPPLR